MLKRITPHLARLIGQGAPGIGAQYKELGGPEPTPLFTDIDPLGEDSRFSPVKGLVHKFENRVLWKVSLQCAAHCRFCTRLRQIGNQIGNLTKADIASALAYIASHKEIDDVILSGGDPFYTPETTEFILQQLANIQSVHVLRIGTRLPVQSPQSFNSKPLKQLVSVLQTFREQRAIYIQVQINHPAELTPEARDVLSGLLRTGCAVVAQTVFLRGINDDEAVLSSLFRKLFYMGIVPYYIYRCDYVRGLEKFVCNLETERTIMTRLTAKLSGIAVPTYVIDVAGRGKIPVPLHFWETTPLLECKDYDGQTVRI